MFTYPSYQQPAISEARCDVYWEIAIPFTDSEISAFDLFGNKVDELGKGISIIPKSNFSGTLKWDLQDIATGIYFINIVYNKTSQKVIPILVSK